MTRKIAVASGKGGTGKTTLATGLAQALAAAGRQVAYVDCDVEEPNGHLLLHPTWERREARHLSRPRLEGERCEGCGACAELCQFGAVLRLAGKAVLFEDLCHACGGCTRVCPTGALVEAPHEIGIIQAGRAGAVEFWQGCLRVGEALAPPLLRQLLRQLPQVDTVLLDAPPGTGCPVVEVVRSSDYVLLVTEPTPFGLHDLSLSVEMLRDLGLAHGVVVNRADERDDRASRFCRQQGIPVLLEVPDRRDVAEAYAEGKSPLSAIPELARALDELVGALDREVPP